MNLHHHVEDKRFRLLARAARQEGVLHGLGNVLSHAEMTTAAEKVKVLGQTKTGKLKPTVWLGFDGLGVSFFGYLVKLKNELHVIYLVAF